MSTVRSSPVVVVVHLVLEPSDAEVLGEAFGKLQELRVSGQIEKNGGDVNRIISVHAASSKK